MIHHGGNIQDPAGYREAIFDELQGDYNIHIRTLHDKLEATSFLFPSVRELYEAHLDDKLIFRHTLPFFITQTTFFKTINDESIDYLYCMILFHTLPLTKLDDFYDGVGKHQYSSSRHENLLTVLGSTTLALSSTHTAAQFAATLPYGHLLLKEALPVTSFVKQRMYQDALERYRTESLLDPAKARRHYLTSSQSKLYGSGYWEVMAIGAFSGQGKSFPPRLHKLDLKLRRLRQLVDEATDVEEDIKAGNITLPLILAAERHSDQKELVSLVTDIWVGRSHNAWPRLYAILHHTKAIQSVGMQARNVWHHATQEIDTYLGSAGAGYQLLFDVQAAKLAMLEEAIGR